MVPLIADRFLSITPALARDLATNGIARLRIERAAADDGAWLDRCAAISTLWHPQLAACLDFGALGVAYRFEAYEVGVPRAGRPTSSARAAAEVAVAAFLRACGVAPGRLESDALADDERCLVLPGAAGSDEPADVRPGAAPVRTGGLRLSPRPALAALMERLRAPASPGVALVEVEAPRGSGGRRLLRDCAREGRRAGWVPVSTTTVAWNDGREAPERRALDDLLAARHLLVLHDARSPDDLTRAALASLVLRFGRRSRLPRLVVTLVDRASTAGALRLEPLAPDILPALVVSTDARLGVRAARVAARARGRPGALAEWLHRARSGAAPRASSARVATTHSLVHEARAPYGFAASRGRHDDGGVADRGEAALVSSTLASAGVLLARGRLAAGERVLRRTQGALARRAAEGGVARLALARGRLLLQVGKWAAACEQFLAAVDDRDDTGPSRAALQAAGWAGRVRLDALDGDGSEALLRSAALAARLRADPVAATWVEAQLARTLWWQGRIDEARALTRAPPGGCLDADPARAACPDGTTKTNGCEAPASEAGIPRGDATTAMERRQADAVWTCEAARAALACGDLAAVTAALAAARAHAGDDCDWVACEVLLARAWWEAAAGDADALRRTARIGLLASRRAREPLLALELRVVTLDGLLRAHQAGAARRVAHRVRRVLARGAPPLVAARARLLLAVCDGRPLPGALRAGLVARGVRACAPGAAGVLFDWPAWSAQRSPRMVDELIEVVRACHEEEPARAAERVTRLLRARLLASTALVLAGDRAPVVVADPPAPARSVLGTARRVIETGLALDPAPVEGGTEAGAPVRYGGAVIGAVACRWPAGLTVDVGRARALLSAAAAAAAPSVEALGRAADPPGLPQVEAELLGTSEAMQDVRRAIARAADAPFGMLVLGESGSGKELVARAVHRASARRARAFCAVNCAALPDDLLEAELFGHTRGAFTGATIDRRGLFEEADGGVLFLDEVGELSPRGQAKLLRVLQDGEVRRLGEVAPRRVDVRVVAATNRVLEREVEAGRFRRDLMYRLDVIRLRVPPLRERIDDVPLLAAAFWRQAADRIGSRAALGDAALAALARHDWPGNVRELQNVIAALVVHAPRRGLVGAQAVAAVLSEAIVSPGAPVTLDEARRRFETRFIRAALARAGGHRGRAAAELGLTRQGLSKLMDRLGLAVPAGGAAMEADARGA